MTVSLDAKVAWLRNHGFTVGARDPRVNTLTAGAFMVIEPHDEAQLPTEDGSNGPWAVIGDDMPYLIQIAYENFCEDVP